MRIIGGQWQGRTVEAPEGIRPMTEMIKQALFNTLGDVEGLRVLDIFAGSGQIGIEALSRGAVFAAFVEKERRNADCIRKTLEGLGVSGASARVLSIDALAYIRQTKTAFDLIFMDPPYEESLAEATLKTAVEQDGLIAPGGRVVLRYTKHEPVSPEAAGTLETVFDRCYGDAILKIWKRNN